MPFGIPLVGQFCFVHYDQSLGEFNLNNDSNRKEIKTGNEEYAVPEVPLPGHFLKTTTGAVISSQSP
jgi:hypothetical protein